MGIFLTDIKKFIKDAEALNHKVVKEIVSEINASVIELSPIDTGNFVSNWLLGIGTAIPWGVTGFKNPDKQEKINRLEARIPQDAANHTYNLVNNTSYAQLLENGYSGQAPLGMVSVTMVKIPSIVRRVIRANGGK